MFKNWQPPQTPRAEVNRRLQSGHNAEPLAAARCRRVNTDACPSPPARICPKALKPSNSKVVAVVLRTKLPILEGWTKAEVALELKTSGVLPGRSEAARFADALSVDAGDARPARSTASSTPSLPSPPLPPFPPFPPLPPRCMPYNRFEPTVHAHRHSRVRCGAKMTCARVI